MYISSQEGGSQSVTKVIRRDGESPESLLRRFRKKVARDRILSDAKRKRYFMSKSEQKRIALRKARRRERKRLWRERRRSNR
jgi:small subunit ribosomal protein S21